MWSILLVIMVIIAIVNKTWRSIMLITFIGYNVYKILGLRKDRTEIEKVIFINGGCVLIGLLLLF